MTPLHARSPHSKKFDDLLGVGAVLCLDFANTVSSRGTDRCSDRLTSYADLIHWASVTGSLDHGALNQMERAANQDAEAAARTYRTAVYFREAIYQVFSTVAAGRNPPTEFLGRLNRDCFRLLAQSAFTQSRKGFVLRWTGESKVLDRVLWPVAWSVFDVLSGDEVALVRACQNPECSWLFIDRSANRTRRWCSMAGCGNIMKARRHYRRQRGSLEM